MRSVKEIFKSTEKMQEEKQQTTPAGEQLGCYCSAIIVCGCLSLLFFPLSQSPHHLRYTSFLLLFSSSSSLIFLEGLRISRHVNRCYTSLSAKTGIMCLSLHLLSALSRFSFLAISLRENKSNQNRSSFFLLDASPLFFSSSFFFFAC